MSDDNNWILVEKKKRNLTSKFSSKKDSKMAENSSTDNRKLYEKNNDKKYDNTNRQERVILYKISQEFKKELENARRNKNLSRKNLAQMINEKESNISAYESGNGFISHNIVGKLNNILDVKLPKLNKIKQEEL